MPELEVLLARARAAWPEVELTEREFLRTLRAGFAAGQTRTEHVGELYLAHACAQGNRAALRAFERQVLAPAMDAVRRLRLGATLTADVAQELRQRLLVGVDGEQARIYGYTGAGPLAGWVRNVALWTALDLQRREGQLASKADLPELVAEGDLELAYLRVRHQAQLDAALESALTSLSVRDRNLLRMKFLDGLNIEQIGKVYGVHRSTVARWLSATQLALCDDVRRRFSDRASVSASEVSSLIELLRSELDVSMRRVLGARP